MLNESQKSVGEGWDTGSHEDFYQYYERQSLTPATLQRFQFVRDMLLRVMARPAGAAPLDVLDIGCNAGTQARFWVECGHRYWGIDINEPLVRLARRRAGEQHIEARFDVGTATAIPAADATVDVCLMPELLEHVVDWQSCLNEAVRVLRPGGVLYVSTSNWLCPVQQEFNLPLYSWYPGPLKRYFERRAMSDRPDLANYAKYPAVHWFSFYQLRGYLGARGCACQDRFDLVDLAHKGALAAAVIGAIRAIAPLRFLGHIATPYTLVVARKQSANS